MKTFSIQMAAQASGLSAHAIRAWEKRYQALTPMRSETGKRMYTESEINRLCLLAQLVNLGSSIGQIARLPDQELKSIFELLSETKNHFKELGQKPQIEESIILNEISKGLKLYDMSSVSKLLTEARESFLPGDFALKIIDPLSNIIQLNEDNSLTQAQNRIFKSLISFHAGHVIYSHYEKDIKTRLKMTLTNLDFTESSLELVITALLCCHHKTNFYYYNTSLPETGIYEAVKATNSNLLVLNLGIQTNRDRLERVLKSVPHAVEVWLMGEVPEDKFPVNVTKIRDYHQFQSLLEERV